MGKHFDMALAAARFCNNIRKYCTNVAIAGSIRRGEAEVSDIDIVAIPLGNDALQALDNKLEAWKEMGAITPRLNKNGNVIAWGGKRRAFITTDRVTNTQVYVDLNLSARDQWGVKLMLATGPAEFNKLLVTPQSKGGLLPEGFAMKDGYLWHNGDRLETFKEWGVFIYLQLPYIDVLNRNRLFLKKIQKYPLVKLWHSLQNEGPFSWDYTYSKGKISGCIWRDEDKIVYDSRKDPAILGTLFQQRGAVAAGNIDWPVYTRSPSEFVYTEDHLPYSLDMLIKIDKDRR